MALRSTFAGLNTMYRGISSSRLSLDTVGHNITNASTTGYSRQSVNLVATRADEVYTVYGQELVGTGNDSLSITRARNVYADKQYWKENGANSFYTSKQTNYDKVEAIFNDSDDTGIENSLEEFYKSWVDLSSNASTTSNRTTTISQGQALADRISTASTQLQAQIKSNYDDISANVTKVNELTDSIVTLNKNIASIESTGANANDLRDQRDNLVDTLSSYMSVNVYENADNGMYTIVSNGASLVSGVSKLNLECVKDTTTDSSTYGVTDYKIQIKETGTTFDAGSGTLAAEVNSIAEDKTYIDSLAKMAAFLLTDFNTQHREGAGIDTNATTGTNFYGDGATAYTWDNDDQAVYTSSLTTTTDTAAKTATTTVGKIDKTDENTKLTGVEIINALVVNSKLTGTDGTQYVAARSAGTTTVTTDAGKTVYTTDTSKMGGTADGSNATLMSTLVNTGSTDADASTKRSIGASSLESFYNSIMTKMGVDSTSVDDKESSQTKIMTQVESWRSSTSGVNWDEELTNMIKFQQGYNACSRCLTTMDEMLDKLINSTGTVGR